MENQTQGSEQSGSPTSNIVIPASATGNDGQRGGSDASDANKAISDKVLADLQVKIGQQGKELGDAKKERDELAAKVGEWESWLTDNQELLSAVDSNIPLRQAILANKLTPELIQAVLNDEITVKEATEEAAEAKEEVKDDLGDSFAEKSPEEIQKLIDKKVKENVKSEVEGAISSFRKESSQKERERIREEEDRKFDESQAKFIAETKDFDAYRSKVRDYIEENPGVADISVAYWAIKGLESSGLKKKSDEAENAEAKKDFAANTGIGGGVNAGGIKQSDKYGDLIQRHRDPNQL